MHSRHLMAMLVTVGAATALSAGGSGAVPLVYQAVEQKLFALPPASARLRPTFSADGGRFACVVRRDHSQVVWLDANTGPAFDEILSLLFSPDGRRLAYTARKGDKRVLVLDGQPSAAYDRLEELVFSADGKRFAYAAGDNLAQRAFVDGQPLGRAYEAASRLTFSPDGKRFAFAGSRPTPQDNTAYLVVDGEQGADLGSEFTAIRFNNDGRQMAYIVLTESGRCVVAGARRGPVFQDVGLLTYSDDGAHFAYVAQRQKHGPWSALVDGRSIGEWDTVESLSFGPDGRHLTLTAQKEGEASRVWIDGKAGPSLEQISGSPVFSPDGRRLAYAVGQREQGIVLDGKMTVPEEMAGITSDEQERIASMGCFSEVGTPAFSTDGNHLAYSGCVNGSRWHLVVDRQAGPSYALASSARPTFAPDGSLTYLAIRGDTLFRVTRRPQPDPIAALNRSELAAKTVVPHSAAARQLAVEVIARVNDRYDRLYRTAVTRFVATCSVQRQDRPAGTLSLSGDKASEEIRPTLKSDLPMDQQAYLLELLQSGLGLSSWLNTQSDRKLYAVPSREVIVLDASEGVAGNEKVERATLFATDDGRYLGSLVRLKDGTEIEERLEPRRDHEKLYLESARLLAHNTDRVFQDVQFRYTYMQRNGFLFLQTMTVSDTAGAGQAKRCAMTVEDVKFETAAK